MNLKEFLDDQGSDEFEQEEETKQTMRYNNNTQRLNFINLLVRPSKYSYRLRKYRMRKTPIDSISYEMDDQIRFRNSVCYSRPVNDEVTTQAQTLKKYLRNKQFIQPTFSDSTPFDIIEWEKEIEDESVVSQLLGREKEVTKYETCDKVLRSEFVNHILEESDWTEEIIYDENCLSKVKPYLTLQLNDPNLIFETCEDKRKTRNTKKSKEIIQGDKPMKSKYNISNDKYYNTEIATKSSLGNLGIQHSVPALKLNPRFYKTFLDKEELRNFHRPSFPLPINASIKLIFIKETNEHKSSEVIKKSTELSLTDGSKFSIFEYSEEFPLLVMNPGMVSLFTTFYRKNSYRDDHAPVGPGQVMVLDPDDPSPFFGFGDVTPGSSIMALTNNLFKAPLFAHKSNDYLCIVDNGKVIVRKIDSLYCVGQCLPLEEVFPPHSRKYNIYCKNRLKVMAYRIFYKKDNRDKILRITQLDDMFPTFSEGSKRKWLKEYADCVKRGRENVWILRPDSALLTEEDLRKLVTPENVCQYESMLAGEQRLRDAGYDIQEDGEDEEEQALSPWCLSRNFISAANGRGILQLTGAGDPSGVGAGFSFMRSIVKKGEEQETKRHTGDLQNRYKETIERIWNKQCETLSSNREILFGEIEDLYNKENMEEEEKPTNEPFIIIKRKIIRNGIKCIEEERVEGATLIRAYLKERGVTKAEEKRSGLKCGSCGATGHMKTNRFCPNFPHKISKKKLENARKRARNFISERIVQTIVTLMNMPYSIAFHRPVSLKKFPNYTEFVSNPIDLGTMKSKARQHKYTTHEEFLEDLMLMKENCRKYNGPEHSLTRLAESMILTAYAEFDEVKEDLEIAEKQCNVANEEEK
ncbi:putative transcription initiation factor [Astathelohania contejeani]|uniref:Transcription initiation factor n=1 Tax=Astathelohania contejeani TaxID=164912 RepID=A0ABQ7I2Q6_9MICR|nr:putative transcription initiation factor [Thelohania contejeani]